jgi:hypothetical protein
LEIKDFRRPGGGTPTDFVHLQPSKWDLRVLEKSDRAIDEAELAAKALKEQLKHAKAVVDDAREKLTGAALKQHSRDRRH